MGDPTGEMINPDATRMALATSHLPQFLADQDVNISMDFLDQGTARHRANPPEEIQPVAKRRILRSLPDAPVGTLSAERTFQTLNGELT